MKQINNPADLALFDSTHKSKIADMPFDQAEQRVAAAIAQGVYTLRAIRLWHWRQAMAYRNRQQIGEEYGGSPSVIKYCKDQADLHIKCVQDLNDFFPVGDTAEKDDQRR